MRERAFFSRCWCERAFSVTSKKAGKMNLGLRCFILVVVTSLAKAKAYSLPYKADSCRDKAVEFPHNGYCCSKCTPGTRLESFCTPDTDTVCKECSAEMYSSSMNYYHNCFFCTKCEEEKQLVYAKNCSRNSDAVCECKPGWYCDLPDGTSCTSCRKHKKCGLGKGAIAGGTATENVVCAECPEGTFSNESSSQPCQPHTRCELQGRSVLIQGNSMTDTVCGPIQSIVPSQNATPNPDIATKASTSPTAPTVKPAVLVFQTTSESISTVYSPPDGGFIGLCIGLPAAASLVVLLIAGFCIHHRKAQDKTALHDAAEAGQCANSCAKSSNPAENQGLLADSSTDPSMSSSSDSHSQCTGVSQDCLHVEQTPVSSPVLNVSITTTINCQVNPATGTCTIPISPCVHLPEPEFPLSQEEELCTSCEQEDTKEAIQSVQESGMTKY